ncbi:hypothetical protein N0V88_005879 [Collariella sp. IMI 366227]|nr:hypothetical protein N0V88_005879 [Collariella sp. IMI 366227]
MSEGIASTTEQDGSIQKIKTFLGAKDDTSRFVGLALLKSVLDNNSELRSNEEAVASLWESIPSRFLDRLIRTGSKQKPAGSSGKESNDMLDLAVSVLHTFASLLPENTNQDGKIIDRIPQLVACLLNCSNETTRLALETLVSLVSQPNGAQVFTAVEDISPLTEIASTQPLALDTLLYAWLYALSGATDKSGLRFKIDSTISSLVSSFKGTDGVTLLAFLAQLLPRLEPEILPKTPNGYPLTQRPLLPRHLLRLASAFNVISHFIGYLVRSMDSDSSTEQNLSWVLPPDLLLKLRKSISETVSLTAEYLRDRWDASVAGAMGLHPDARSGAANTSAGSRFTLAWDSKSDNASDDPLILAAVRMMALWVREDENELLRREVAGLGILAILEEYDGEQRGGFREGVEVVRVLMQIGEGEQPGPREAWLDLVTKVAAWSVPEGKQSAVVEECQVAVLQLVTTLLVNTHPGMQKRVRQGVCKTFHDHPERSISSPSVLRLHESKRRPRLNNRLGSVSEAQFRPGTWGNVESSAGASQNVMLPACRCLQRADSTHPISWPQANVGTKRLLELSDSVRSSLVKHNTVEGSDADQLSLFLQLALAEEVEDAPTIDLDTVKAARLDKLVAILTEDYEPGRWWLTLSCALQDGVVATDRETTSKGDDKVPTVPLLTGKELHIGLSKVRYFREGPLSEMHLALISLTGKPVRVLRGHLLDSVFAPSAGIRNDGIHKLDPGTGVYRVEVNMEKVPGQMTLHELMKIPRPSQIDDWQLYQKTKTRNGKDKELEGLPN